MKTQQHAKYAFLGVLIIGLVMVGAVYCAAHNLLKEYQNPPKNPKCECTWVNPPTDWMCGCHQE